MIARQNAKSVPSVLPMMTGRQGDGKHAREQDWTETCGAHQVGTTTVEPLNKRQDQPFCPLWRGCPLKIINELLLL